MDLPRLTEPKIFRQAKVIGFSLTRRSLVDWAQRGIYEPPYVRARGRGNLKEYAPETIPEIYARHQANSGAGRFTLSQDRIIRETALLIEKAPNLTPANYEQETKRLTAVFADKAIYLDAIVVWLRSKWDA